MEGSSDAVQRLFADALRQHQAGEGTKAEALCRQILAIDAGHADSWHLVGIIALQSGKSADAVELIAKAITINDTVPTYHSTLAAALIEQGRLVEAEASLQRTLTLDPTIAEVHSDLGNVLKRQGKLDQAAGHYVRALTINPQLAHAHYNLGNTRHNQGRLDEAAVCYQRALAVKPDFAEAHYNLAVLRGSQGKVDDAAAHYERALSFNPNLAEAHNNLGNILRGRGRLNEAAAHYARALELKPDDADAHSNLGCVLTIQGRADDAIACFARALALDPNFAHAHNNLGVVLREQERYAEAIASHRRALALKPEFIDARYNLGIALSDLDQLDEAQACFEQVLDQSPDHVDAHFALGNAYSRCDRKEEAQALYQRAHRLRPLRKRAGIKERPDFSVLLPHMLAVGNTPSGYLLGRATYDSYFLMVMAGAAYDVAALRDKADVVVNLISDADRCRDVLPLAVDLIDRIGRPTVNHPRKIQATGRADIAARLVGIPHCRMPKTVRLSGPSLGGNDASRHLGEYAFPLLVRRTGVHSGEEFEKLADLGAIADFVRRKPDADYYVSGYVPYDSPDGFYRKYRLIFVDGQILPYHLAIDDQWKVHHFRTDMANQEWMRREEKAFVEDPTRVLMSEHWAALQAIRNTVGLDYFGIDCAIDRNGDLLVFEVNATMLVHGEKGIFAYKESYVARIKSAFDAMLAKMASASGRRVAESA